jgi:hypothetical protein
MKEVWNNYITGNTLYFCAFADDGNVQLTGGASNEVWGTGGRDASDYAETMTEDGVGGHYVGDFVSTGEGTYRVTVYLQAGANPADSDSGLAQGEIYWDGKNEINLFSEQGLKWIKNG